MESYVSRLVIRCVSLLRLQSSSSDLNKSAVHTQILHVKTCLHRADARHFVDLIGELNQFLHTVIQVDGFIPGASMMMLTVLYTII